MRLFCVVGAVLAMVGSSAVAESFVCDWNKVPILQVVQSSGADAGMPGLMFVAVRSPDQQLSAFLGQGGEWIPYEGGLFPPARVFVEGLPGTVPVSVGYKAEYVGWELYAGTGALTASGQNMVRQRREALDKVRPMLEAKGKWRKAFEDDDQMKWSLVHRDMVDGVKYRFVTTVPAMSCDDSGS